MRNFNIDDIEICAFDSYNEDSDEENFDDSDEENSYQKTTNEDS